MGNLSCGFGVEGRNGSLSSSSRIRCWRWRRGRHFVGRRRLWQRARRKPYSRRTPRHFGELNNGRSRLRALNTQINAPSMGALIIQPSKSQRVGFDQCRAERLRRLRESELNIAFGVETQLVYGLVCLFVVSVPFDLASPVGFGGLSNSVG